MQTWHLLTVFISTFVKLRYKNNKHDLQQLLGMETYKNHSLLLPYPEDKDIISIATVFERLKVVSNFYHLTTLYTQFKVTHNGCHNMYNHYLEIVKNSMDQRESHSSLPTKKLLVYSLRQLPKGNKRWSDLDRQMPIMSKRIWDSSKVSNISAPKVAISLKQ